VVERRELGSGGRSPLTVDLTASGAGFLGVALFVIAYVLVMTEDLVGLRKSVPIMIAAGVIWMLVAVAYGAAGHAELVGPAFARTLLDFAELFLFLLAAVTYVNTMEERQIFDALRAWLVARRFTYRQLFWITGLLAFVISPVADNMTTALVVGAVVMAVAGNDARFLTLACVNIVVAANAGGAFSPFGDITTLMVWQKGVVSFWGFFDLLLPAAVNWLVPAAIMSFAVERKTPVEHGNTVRLRRGAGMVVALFVATIALTVAVRHFLDLPPVLGMMTGLGALHLYGHWVTRTSQRSADADNAELLAGITPDSDQKDSFDVLAMLQRTEWDTLMFFYGVILCVGGLAAFGYLALASQALYAGMGATGANVLVGLLSAVIDNIPIMFAVLTMNPAMSQSQWLLVTLTAGVGGSLLSIGSAAGVALMGQARGTYTFASHLKWAWAVALGFAASVLVHLALNGR
jgi:Na+/H+ antiporter NhaD/arsenite permease-like protein